MSVSNPVDSGGIGLNSFDRELQGFAEKLNTVGGWAEIMAEDSKNNTFDTEDNKRSDEPVEDDFADVIDHGPPYKLQLYFQLLPRSQCDKDELYYFFGGENKVADMIFRDNNRVIITFKDIKDYAFYYREKDFKCNDVSIRAFRIQNNNINRESHPYSRQNSQNQYQPQRDSYSRQGSFHDSSQSLASSHHGDRRQDYDRRYNNRKDYMPPSGYRDDSSRGNNRGRHRGGPRSHYDGPGEIQRSGSYSYDGNRPAPIFRSRTDDGLADRRQSGLMSRTSSQYSVNTEGEKPMAKKPSTRDIFGDAKPVDSTSRLNEVEAKMEGKKKQEAEKAEKEKKEKERLQQQQQPQQPQPNQQPQQAPSQQAPPPNAQPPMIYSFPTGLFNHPPPNYYQSYPQYATPIVNMGPGGIHPPQHMTTPPPMYSANNNQPYRGEVKFVQRNSVEKEAGPESVSPPLDPEHPRQQMDRPPPSHPIETIKEEPSPLPPRRSSQSDAKPDDKQGKQFNRPRTFQNSSHRGTFDGNRGGFNRGRGGSRGGRGGGQQKSKTDQTYPNQPEPKTPTTEAPPVAEATKETRAKDHHGSHASLSSRGGRGGGRGGRGGRGGGGFHKQDNKERPPKAEGQKEQQKPKQGEKDKRKYSKEDPQKNTAVNPAKTEVKKEIPKEETTPATTTKAESTPTTPVDAKEKKKEKKKKSAAKNATPLNGNKFAALLDADE